MKVTIDTKKGLKTNLKVFVDKKTIEEKIDERLTELSKTANIKGFRPGKVPADVLKRQFGKAVYGEVLEKILKETSTGTLPGLNPLILAVLLSSVSLSSIFSSIVFLSTTIFKFVFSPFLEFTVTFINICGGQ